MRQSDEGRWSVPQAAPTKVSDAEASKAAAMAILVNAGRTDPEVDADLPADTSDLPF